MVSNDFVAIICSDSKLSLKIIRNLSHAYQITIDATALKVFPNIIPLWYVYHFEGFFKWSKIVSMVSNHLSNFIS